MICCRGPASACRMCSMNNALLSTAGTNHRAHQPCPACCWFCPVWFVPGPQDNWPTCQQEHTGLCAQPGGVPGVCPLVYQLKHPQPVTAAHAMPQCILSSGFYLEYARKRPAQCAGFTHHVPQHIGIHADICPYCMYLPSSRYLYMLVLHQPLVP